MVDVPTLVLAVGAAPSAGAEGAVEVAGAAGAEAAVLELFGAEVVGGFFSPRAGVPAAVEAGTAAVEVALVLAVVPGAETESAACFSAGALSFENRFGVGVPVTGADPDGSVVEGLKKLAKDPAFAPVLPSAGADCGGLADEEVAAGKLKVGGVDCEASGLLLAPLMVNVLACGELVDAAPVVRFPKEGVVLGAPSD